jgi:hypothetical protein
LEKGARKINKKVHKKDKNMMRKKMITPFLKIPKKMMI